MGSRLALFHPLTRIRVHPFVSHDDLMKNKDNNDTLYGGCTQFQSVRKKWKTLKIKLSSRILVAEKCGVLAWEICDIEHYKTKKTFKEIKL